MTQALLVKDRPITWSVPTEVLLCPVTRSPLVELSPIELDILNVRIGDGQLRHLDDSPVTRPCQTALQTKDGSLVYRIEDGIIVLLPALAIVADDSQSFGYTALTGNKRDVQNFYDQVGWHAGDGGDFVDAVLWEDRRDVSSAYIRKCHMRVARHIKPAGKYLLDAASGPIQYPEYLNYSQGYTARICVDISFAALKQAQRKLGRRGVYILADVTNLPLRDGAVDGVVSLHTIYHVPADEQADAFREIFRVLKPGCSAAVVYCWRSRFVKAMRTPARLARLPFRTLGKLVRAIRGRRPRKVAAGNTQAEQRIYYHAHKYSWFADNTRSLPAEVYVWRSIDVPLMRAYVHKWFFGRALLAVLFRLEEWLPRLCGRLGAYPLIVIYKP